MRLIAIALLWLAPALAAAQDDAGAPTPAEPAPTVVDGVTIPPEVGPIRWAESHGRQCHRSRGHRMCEGPRRVPVAEGEPAARAEALGITSAAARRVLTERPRDAWIAEAGGAAPSDLLWPVQGGRLWRTFGLHQGIVVRRGRLAHTRRRHPHEGIDIGAARGTPILAANDGLVVYSDNGMTGYGNGVLVVHGDGSVTLYGHCAATFVVAGQRVRRGQIIAAVGDTGLAHGAHLHFELHVEGQAVDPLPRIAARPDVAAPPSDAPGSPAPSPEATTDPAAPPDEEPDEELDEP